MMQSVQTDIVQPTPVSHAQTNTSPLQMNFQRQHTSSQTDGIKTKSTGSQYMFKQSRTSFPTKYKHYDVIDNFCKFLEEKNQMPNFVNGAMGLIENKIDSKNLAWQSALHVGQYSACSTTTVMRYDPEYMEFIAVINLVWVFSTQCIMRSSPFW